MKRIFQDAIAEIISYATHLLIIEPIIGRIKKAIDEYILTLQIIWQHVFHPICC